MKRKRNYLWLILLTVSVLVFGAQVSAQDLWEEDEVEYYFSEEAFEEGYCEETNYLLSDSVRNQLKERIIAACEKYDTVLDISDLNIAYADRDGVRSLIYEISGMPDYFYLISGAGYTSRNNVLIRITLSYRWPIEELPTRREKYTAAVKEALSGVNASWSDMEKALYIHDWLASWNSYDYTYLHHSAYDALVGKTSVCQGYAEAYKTLMTYLGIDCGVVTSTQLNHAWNRVKINGNYYNVDVTWDDLESRIYHWWFLKSDNYYGTARSGEHAASDYSYPKGMEASRTIYDSMFWDSISHPIKQVGHSVYTNDPKELAVCEYVCNGANWTKKTSFTRRGSVWKVIGSSGNWVGDFSAVDTFGGRIYYNTNESVYEINPADGAERLIYSLTAGQKAAYQIYGLTIDKTGKCTIILAEQPYREDNTFTFQIEGVSPLPEEEKVPFPGSGNKPQDKEDPAPVEPDGPGEFVLDNGLFRYFENGVFQSAKYGYVNVGGGKFLVANGLVAQNISGLANDPEHPDDWYYLANGQAQTQYSGLCQYDGAWFYVEKGKMDTKVAGFVPYDGSMFYVSVGRIVKELNGLAQDTKTGDWYFVSQGQVQNQYTGLCEYDGQWFYVKEGKLASNYTGVVTYNGAYFYVVNGRLSQ